MLLHASELALPVLTVNISQRNVGTHGFEITDLGTSLELKNILK